MLLVSCSMNHRQTNLLQNKKEDKINSPKPPKLRVRFTFHLWSAIKNSSFSDFQSLDLILLQFLLSSHTSKRSFLTKILSKLKTLERCFMNLKKKCRKSKLNSSKLMMKRWTQGLNKKSWKIWKKSSKDKKAKSRNLNLRILVFTKESLWYALIPLDLIDK